MKKALIAAVFALAATHAGIAQATAAPTPYVDEEFPEWALELRRFEIITIGAFPIALFFTSFGFDSYDFFFNPDITIRFNPAYAPWPFGAGRTLTQDEIVTRVLVALSVSAVIGFIDWLILELSDE
jgi:hypothetical protein